MNKNFKKLLTLIVVFSMILGMGVSFASNEGKLNIRVNTSTLIIDGVTVSLTVYDPEGIKLTQGMNNHRLYGVYIFKLSTDNPEYEVVSFLVETNQASITSYRYIFDVTSPATVHIDLVSADLKNITVEKKITIKYISSDEEMGTVTRAEEIIGENTGEAKGSLAEAKTGYEFVNWTDESGTEVGTDPTFVPKKVDEKNVAKTYTANFKSIDTGDDEEEQITIKYISSDEEMGTVTRAEEIIGENTGEAKGRQ